MTQHNSTSLAIVGLAVAMLCGGPPAGGSPIVLNPSFETDTFTNGPGGTVAQNFPITSWADDSPTDVGLNPFWNIRPTSPGGSPHADNGAIPDGDQVAFLRYNAALSQDVSGFRIGRRYEVVYFENNRSGSHNNGSLQVLLGGSVVVPDHTTSAVGGTNPYRFVTSDMFTATAATHTLTFQSTSGADRSVLIDNVAIQPVTTSLKARWALDETSGQTAFDDGPDDPKAYDGRLGTSTSPDAEDPAVGQPGKIGRAYAYNAAEQDRVVLSSHAGDFAADASGAISLWFNTSSTARQPLLDFGRTNHNDRLLAELTGGKLRFLVRTGDTNTADMTTSDPYTDGQWHHVVVSQTAAAGGSGLKMFVDGQEPPLGTDVRSDDWFHNIGSVNYFALGYEVRQSFEAGLDGLLDDVAIWNPPLSDAEALALFALGSSAELGYGALEAGDLFDLHWSGSGSVEIGRLRWTPFSGASGTAGELVGSGSDFTLWLTDSSGVRSAAIPAIPEPSSAVLWALGALGALIVRRRRT